MILAQRWLKFRQITATMNNATTTDLLLRALDIELKKQLAEELAAFKAAQQEKQLEQAA